MERLNPVLITGLSAGLALIPLALSRLVRRGAGNEIQRPMAVVVLGGLPTAVELNMLVVPALFLRYGVERPGAFSAALGEAMRPVAEAAAPLFGNRNFARLFTARFASLRKLGSGGHARGAGGVRVRHYQDQRGRGAGDGARFEVLRRRERYCVPSCRAPSQFGRNVCVTAPS